MSEDAVRVMVRSTVEKVSYLNLADRLSFVTSLLTTVMANDKARALYERDPATAMTVDTALTLQVGLLKRLIGVERHGDIVDALRAEFGAESQFDTVYFEVHPVRRNH